MSVRGFKFTVQPIKKALVNTDIHPVVVETEVFTYDTVMALVWVVSPAREELTGPHNANGDLIPSLEVTLPNQMIVQASPPTDLMLRADQYAQPDWNSVCGTHAQMALALSDVRGRQRPELEGERCAGPELVSEEST